MPYGGDSASIGSLELLAEHVSPNMIDDAAAVTAGGRRPEDVRDLMTQVGHGQFDLVIMNPPFTRSVGQEGQNIGTGNPAFAGFETPKRIQREMQKQLKRVAGKEALGTGNAGIASHFGDLAIRKVNADGQLAFVLPLSAAVGQAWEALRTKLLQEFHDITVVSIAKAGSFDQSFSADTGMAELLLLTNRGESSEARIRFVSLGESPASTMSGMLIADQIEQQPDARRLDTGPIGGTKLNIGDASVGEMIDCAPDDLKLWNLVGVKDMSLAQTAFQLQRGSLALPGSSSTQPFAIECAPIGKIAEVGPYHADIYWSDAKGEPRGPLDLLPIDPAGQPTYPILWAHDAPKERQLIVAPDKEGQVKTWHEDQESLDDKAREVLMTANRTHYNRDFRFNSQSLIVAMTERACIGGVAWPSVILNDPDHEHAFALWCNSTLGLLMHWWVTNKTQSGRGRTSVTHIPTIPTLDTRALTDDQHAEARRQFDRLRNERFLPFDQIDEDPARAKLDRAILVDVLGLPEYLVEPDGPIDLIRRKLAREPQIHGGKKSRVVFTDDGETTQRRTDRG